MARTRPLQNTAAILDSMFNITLVLYRYCVRILTHIALFWFAYKYRWQRKS
jgi:hypothetical protein